MTVLFPLILALGASTPPQSLLVLPVQAKSGVAADVAELATQLVAAEAAKQGAFRVVTLLEVEGTMSQEQRKQVAGCDAVGCAAEIAGALSTDQLVMGALGHIGDQYVITLTRVRSRDAEVLARAVMSASTADQGALLPAIKQATAALFTGPGAAPPAAAVAPVGKATPAPAAAPPVSDPAAAKVAATPAKGRPWKWLAIAAFVGCIGWLALLPPAVAASAGAAGVMVFDRVAALPAASDHVVNQPVALASDVTVVAAPLLGVVALGLAAAFGAAGVAFIVLAVL